MKFLIPTEPDDIHAIIVKAALEAKKHKVTLIFTADLPTKQRNSVFVDNQSYKWQCLDNFSSINDEDYEVVWWRRARRPFIPQNISHPDDHEFINRENVLFFESFTSNLAPSAWWINSKESARRANFKLLQLKIASECGIKIPTTLCSNDPKEIFQFINRHQENGVIYKPLCSHFWFDENQTKISYTAKINEKNLPNHEILQKTPGIFQTEIKKKYELRVTCFGDYIVTAKIDSQSHADGIIDWRAIRQRPLKIEEYKLPINLEIRIRTFMREMGIVFGTFDFIVTNNNEYIFLEVNEQGQFLWIEELNPKIKMLDIFINFMLNKSPHFEWDKNNAYHSIDKYRSKVQAIYNDNMQKHICLNIAEMDKQKKRA